MMKSIILAALAIALISGCSFRVDAPVISEGIIYVRSFEGVTAYDQKTGEELWKKETDF